MSEIVFHPAAIDPAWSVRDVAVRLGSHGLSWSRQLGTWVSCAALHWHDTIGSAVRLLHSGVAGARQSHGRRTHSAAIADVPVRMTDEEQWILATRAAAAAAQRAGNADELQAAARSQVDAATYALERLLEDIAPLMTIRRPNAAGAGGAVVRRLEPAADDVPRRGDALAA